MLIIPTTHLRSPNHIHVKTADNKDLFILTGVVTIGFGIEISNFKCTVNNWHREDVLINVPIPPVWPQSETKKLVEVESCIPFVTLSSFKSRDESPLATGFAVDEFNTSVKPGDRVSLVTADVKVAVMEGDSTLHRLGYHFTLLGNIDDVRPGELQPRTYSAAR